MPGIMGVGRQYAQSSLTGAITADASMQAKHGARQQLNLQRQAMVQDAQYKEKQMEMAQEQKTKQTKAAAGAMLGGAIGAGVTAGSPIGFMIGSAIGGFIGGLF